jgi:Rrf2 family protein
MISQSAEYALRAVVFLAERPDERWTSLRIAEATQVPAGYLAKILQSLGRAGIVSGQRGLGGGFRLSRPPSELSLLRVVEAVDPIRRIESCPLKLEAHAAGLCPLHRRLEAAIDQIRSSFQETTVADILSSLPTFQGNAPRGSSETRPSRSGKR